MPTRIALAAALVLSLHASARAFEEAGRATGQFSEPKIGGAANFGDYADQARRRTGEAPAPVFVDVERLQDRASVPLFSHPEKSNSFLLKYLVSLHSHT